MPVHPIAVTPSTYPAPHPVVGIDVTVLVSREATGGHEITLQSGGIGAGPPPHSHPWDESFFVVKGAVDFTVEGKTTRATPGAFFHLPAGTVHAFQICEDGSQMMEVTGAGSRSSSMFRAIGEEMAPGKPKPEDVGKLVGILNRFGADVQTD
jgi:quercetin dioxygenase-like cupin family protein